MKAAATLPSLGNALGHEIVDLYISPTRHHFRVHKSLLCTRVPYFAAMFNSSFTESTTSTAHLLKDDPEIFSLFLEWVYSRRLAPVTAAAMALPNNSHLFMDRVKLYIFAEKVCLDELCDYTITNLMSLLQQYERNPTVQ